jgi:hypothetical protein
MRFAVRLAPLLCLAAGCAFGQKPYAADPLLRGGRGARPPREGPPAAAPVAPSPIEPPPPPQADGTATSRRWE